LGQIAIFKSALDPFEMNPVVANERFDTFRNACLKDMTSFDNGCRDAWINFKDALALMKFRGFLD